MINILDFFSSLKKRNFIIQIITAENIFLLPTSPDTPPSPHTPTPIVFTQPTSTTTIISSRYLEYVQNSQLITPSLSGMLAVCVSWHHSHLFPPVHLESLLSCVRFVCGQFCSLPLMRPWDRRHQVISRMEHSVAGVWHQFLWCPYWSWVPVYQGGADSAPRTSHTYLSSDCSLSGLETPASPVSATPEQFNWKLGGKNKVNRLIEKSKTKQNLKHIFWTAKSHRCPRNLQRKFFSWTWWLNCNTDVTFGVK